MKRINLAFSLIIVFCFINLPLNENPPQLADTDHKQNKNQIPNIEFNDNEKLPIEPLSRGNEPVRFDNVSVQANLDNIRGNHYAWGDYNADGYEDLLIGSKLFENSGGPNYSFTDVTSAKNISGGGKGTWADYDNDGYLDFYTTNNKLWHNDGPSSFTFTDVTFSAGNLTDPYPTTASGWGDFDHDGDLDLYVVNGEEYINNNFVFYPDIFYENNGDGTFTDKTLEKGLDTSNNLAYGRSANWGDYNNDGWIDIQVGNYRLRPNYLWRNNHNGTFTDVAQIAETAGVYDPERYFDSQAQTTYGDGTWGPTWGHTIGSAWGDLDNDLDLDLWDSNLVHKYVGPTSLPNMPYDIRGYVCDDSKIYRNNGGPWYNFTDVRLSSGIPFKPIGPSGTYQGDELWSGVAMGDFDNDGDLDVFVPQIYDLNYAYSFLFQNNNDGTFTDVAQQLGLRAFNTYGATWSDYNNDGFLDLAVGGKNPFVGTASGSYETHLYKNQGNSNNWVKIRLIGQDNNKYGMGAKVIVNTTQGSQLRQVEGGMGSHSQQNQIILHFGLGSASLINTIEVQWPNGKAQVLNNLGVNTLINISENNNGPNITSISTSKTIFNEDEVLVLNGSAIDYDGTITKYEWDIDGDSIFDWSSTTSARVSVKYYKAGEYYAKLRVWDDSGTLYTDRTTDFFTVKNIPPIAQAGSDIIVFEDEIITFNGSGSIDTASDRSNLSFNWSFGDNIYLGWQNSSTIQYSYSLRGEYDVVLYVRDDDGEIDFSSFKITVNNKAPTNEIIAVNTVSEDVEIIFNVIGNDTVSDLPNLIYKWDFDDGNTSSWTKETFTSHIYQFHGTYIVRCTVRDDEGVVDEGYSEKSIIVYNIQPECRVEDDKSAYEDQKVYLNGSGNDNITDRISLSFLWDFADGSTSKDLPLGKQNVSHVYKKQGVYQAKLIVIDNDGATCSKIINITIKNSKPKCWVMDDLQVIEDEIIEFNGVGDDSESDFETLSYSWNFGINGLPNTNWKSSTEFQYSYSNAGEYFALLMVRDDDGDIGNASVTIRVINVDPDAKFLASALNVNEDEMVEFDARESTDTPSDISLLEYAWDFGDGSPISSGKKVTYSYTDADEYRVVLSVTDDNGRSDTYKKNVKVRNVMPNAILTSSAIEAFVGDELIFSGIESSDTISDIDNLIFQWSINDKVIGSNISIAHSFDKVGNYKVKLTVTDDDSASAQNDLVIKVNKFNEGKAGSDVENYDNEVKMSIVIVVCLIIVLLMLIFLFVIKNRKSKDNDTKEIMDEQDPIIPQPILEPFQQTTIMVNAPILNPEQKYMGNQQIKNDQKGLKKEPITKIQPTSKHPQISQTKQMMPKLPPAKSDLENDAEVNLNETNDSELMDNYSDDDTIEIKYKINDTKTTKASLGTTNMMEKNIESIKDIDNKTQESE